MIRPSFSVQRGIEFVCFGGPGFVGLAEVGGGGSWGTSTGVALVVRT
jgi:hypothetical protein